MISAQTRAFVARENRFPLFRIMIQTGRHAVTAPRPQVRCREIGEADLDSVADLLTRGFFGRSRDYWMRGLLRQAARDVPQGYPRFGYMLDREGTPVGVLLLLYSLQIGRAS